MAKTTVTKTDPVSDIRFVYASKGEVASAPGGDTEFHAHECADCGSQFAVTAALESPFCTVCASTDVKVIDNPQGKIEQIEQLIQANSDDLVAVQCGSSRCGAHLVFSSAYMHELQGTICCPVCSSANKFEYEAEASDDDMDDEEDATVQVGGEETARKKAKPHKKAKKQEDDEDEDEEEDASDLEEAEDLEIADDLEQAAEEEASEEELADIEDDEDDDEDDLEDIPDYDDEDEENASEQTAADQDTETASDKEDTSEETASEETQDEPAAEDQTATTASEQTGKKEEAADAKVEAKMQLRLIDAVEASAEKQHAVAFNRAGKRIMAHINNISVAFLEEAAVEESRRAAFNDATFLKALANSVGTHGLRATLDNFGFSYTEIQADAAKFGALAEERIQTAAAEITAETAQQVSEEFANTLGIASVGINKSFWKGRENPIKAALTAKLQAAGLRNAERLVAEAFDEHGNAYQKLLIDTAHELLSKPVDVRNSLAEAIGDVNGMSKVQASAEDDDNYVVADSGSEEVVAGLDKPFRVSRETASTITKKTSDGHASVVETASAVRQRFGSLFPKG